MAKQMAFSDQFGNTYPASYWRLVYVAIDAVGGNARLVFYGYKDKAARDAAKVNIGQKAYDLSGAEFQTYYAHHLEPNGPNLMTLCYEYCGQKKDVPQGGELPDVSFFETATDV